MRSKSMKSIALLAGVFAVNALSVAAEPAKLNVLNWSELIPQDTVVEYGKAQGVKVQYDIMDSDDSLEAKLMAGNSGYDVVYPSSSFMIKQIKAGAYEPIDWSKLPNGKNLDPALLAKLQTHDPKNEFGVPFLWGTDGMLVNVKKVKAILGEDFDLNTWDLLFKPEVVSKLKSCGVSVLDSPQDVFSLMLRYLGKDANTDNPEDYQLAYEQLVKIWPSISQVTSTPRDPITRGDTCIAMAWSGDAGVVQRIITENKLDMEVRYITPKNQTPIWFTMMGIPKDSKNKQQAYEWINYLLDAKVATSLTEYNSYPSAVLAAQQTGQTINDGRYAPSAEEINTFYVFESIPPRTIQVMTRFWRKLYTSGG
jgi:putrescine transport system substrate-binding protein